MAERYFEINSYRSLGIMRSERLLINTSLDKTDIGNLIIVVGENNAGKTNVIKALKSFQTSFTTRDIPQYVNLESKLPSVNLYIKNFPHIIKISKNYQNEIKYFMEKNNAYEEVADSAKLKQDYQDNHGYDILPSIYEYIEVKYTQDDLYINRNEIASSQFFSNLLQVLNIEQMDIPIINQALKAFSKQFNHFYLLDHDDYAFKVTLENEELSFAVYLHGKKLNLDYQSSGFRWFFNFYFSFANMYDIKAGDILIMDEPALSLHIRSMIELRKYFKEIAERKGLTIILSTNMPFLIDCDYLDELRIVRKVNDFSEIENYFTMMTNGSDSLNAILNTLTIGRHIMVAPHTTVVFVEGITDYNYLTAFKNLFAIKNLLFLPIQGVNHKNLAKDLLSIQRNPILLVDNDAAGNYAKKQINNKIKVISLGDINSRFVAIESLFNVKDLQKNNLKDKSFINSSNFKNNISNIELSKDTVDNFKSVIKYILNNAKPLY